MKISTWIFYKQARALLSFQYICSAFQYKLQAAPRKVNTGTYRSRLYNGSAGLSMRRFSSSHRVIPVSTSLIIFEPPAAVLQTAPGVCVKVSH